MHASLETESQLFQDCVKHKVTRALRRVANNANTYGIFIPPSMVDSRLTRPLSAPDAESFFSAFTLATAAAAVAPRSPAVRLRRFTAEAGETLELGDDADSSTASITAAANLTGGLPDIVLDRLCTIPLPSWAFFSNIFMRSLTDMIESKMLHLKSGSEEKNAS